MKAALRLIVVFVCCGTILTNFKPHPFRLVWLQHWKISSKKSFRFLALHAWKIHFNRHQFVVWISLDFTVWKITTKKLLYGKILKTGNMLLIWRSQPLGIIFQLNYHANLHPYCWATSFLALESKFNLYFFAIFLLHFPWVFNLCHLSCKVNLTPSSSSSQYCADPSFHSFLWK